MLPIQFSHLCQFLPHRLHYCFQNNVLQFPYLCPSLSTRDLYKIQGTITVLCILILMFLESRRAEHVNCRKPFPKSACLQHFHECHFDLLLMQQILKQLFTLVAASLTALHVQCFLQWQGSVHYDTGRMIMFQIWGSILLCRVGYGGGGKTESMSVW